ncbi:MAG: N-acetylmuramoyl-L-alanine amidase [Spirochaetales bacterium]|nr:N-acetylmuramoyl-L-alanine amidase [Spirochaetales bacterium]
MHVGILIRHPYKFLLFLGLLLFYCAPWGTLWAQPVSLEQLLIRSGATMQWNPWRREGRLVKEGRVIVFQPGQPWFVLDGGRLLSGGTVIERDGQLVFSTEAASAIYSAFGMEDSLPQPYRLTTILIDPGHGGRDSGASRTWPVDDVLHPLPEKDVVLEISLRLAQALQERYPQKNVLLTRDNDVYPSLEERVAMANGVETGVREGMIYISIHANASLNAKAEGFEVWYLPRDYRRTLEDKSEGLDSRIAPIVNALWEEEFTHESVRLADMILDGFSGNLGDDVANRGRREESWFVVRNARMASVLVEIGFLTNPSEAQRLRRPEYLSRITEGLYNGVADFVRYFESKESYF